VFERIADSLNHGKAAIGTALGRLPDDPTPSQIRQYGAGTEKNEVPVTVRLSSPDVLVPGVVKKIGEHYSSCFDGVKAVGLDKRRKAASEFYEQSRRLLADKSDREDGYLTPE
jgi:hypothetical protein